MVEALVHLEAAAQGVGGVAAEIEAECERRLARLREAEAEVRRLSETRGLEDRVRELV